MFHKTAVQFVIFMAVFLAPIIAYGQEAKPTRPTSVYKIDYVFSELQNDKRVNARSYSLLVRGGERGSIRLGNRFPITTGEKEGTTQLQYLDIGVNIDGRVGTSDVPDANSAIDLFTNVDISSLAPEQPADNRTGSPVVRQIKFQNENIVPLGKQVLLSSADEIDGTRRLQVEVTATKIR